MASSDTAPQAGDSAQQSNADLVEHLDGALPRGPAHPPPVATLGLGALTVGALGVVFGDIGTSPLYSLQTVFAADHNRIPVTRNAVYGVISMIVWTLLIVVSVKYVALVMRADN